MKIARPLVVIALLCITMTLTGVCTCAAGLHMQLTHVDAKANITITERVHRAVERTRRRLAFVGGGGVAAPVRWGELEYIAEYSIGNPPQLVQAVVDTGSDLVWTQSMTCRPNCFSQDLDYYNYSRSFTAHSVPCNHTLCAAAAQEMTTLCMGENGACTVVASYGSGVVAGFLGVEEFTFGLDSGSESVKVAMAFGGIRWTDIEQGSLNGASGLIGLGRGALSMVSQLGANVFSYCFTPYFSGHQANSSGHLFVGSSARLRLSNTPAPVTTVPFVASPKEKYFSIFYYLPLVGMTVGKVRLPIPAAVFDLRLVAPGKWAGGVIIDSGAPYTGLVDEAYEALRKEVVRQLGGSLVPSPVDWLELCVARGDVGRLVPPLVLNFDNGAGLVLPPENYWAPVDEATACMVVFSSTETVIGNYMQQGMHVLYDIGNGAISFQPADCGSI